MRKVELRMNETQKYEVIKMYMDNKVTKIYCMNKLRVTIRTVNRLIKVYKEKGKAGFMHGNRGKKPVTAKHEGLAADILLLYQNKYEGANLSHYTQLLNEQEGIIVSEPYVRNVFRKNHILPPKAWKKTKRAEEKRLRDLQKNPAVGIREKEMIDSKLLDLEFAHPRRERRANFGELIQMDASLHLWFGSKKTTLHASIDDATGQIVGLYMCEQETLRGYYTILHQILTAHGIPMTLFTDRRTVFEYKKVSSPTIEKDTFTQFSYACSILGITLETSSIPQAKGRIERLFQTLQSRLPVEFKLNNIQTIEDANKFLTSYLKKFNETFSLPIHHSKNVFIQQPDTCNMNQILAVLAPRVIDAGHCIKFKKDYYLPVNGNGMEQYFVKGTKVLVIQAYNDELYATIDETVYALKKIEKRAEVSYELEQLAKPVPRKYHIPPMSHPWKEASFQKYMMKMQRMKEYSKATAI